MKKSGAVEGEALQFEYDSVKTVSEDGWNEIMKE